MKFKEFKTLIEKRKNLIQLKTIEKDVNAILEFEIQIEEIEEEIFGETGYVFPKLNKLFFVETENVQKFLEGYFKDKKVEFQTGFEGFDLNLMVFIGNKGYNLGRYDQNTILRCLYDGAWNDGWNSLLNDYQDLLEYLWQAYRGFKVETKNKELSLIQKKLNTKKSELLFLQNPEKVESRINELTQESKNIEKRVEILIHELERFN